MVIMIVYSLVNDSSYKQLDYVTTIGILETKGGSFFSLSENDWYHFFKNILMIKHNKMTGRACKLFDIYSLYNGF